MLVQKFEESVEKFPHNTALHTGQRELSYDELNRAANRLVWRIQKIAASGSWPGHQVGLLFEHGADMIVGMLGALKSGMIYIPLDVTYPLDRLKYMLSDSGAGLILTNRENEPLARKLVRGTAPAVQFMDIGSIPESEKGENIPRQASAEQPTYILYTSGSTGRPKGVVQNHRNVWYYVRNWIQRFSITPRDRLTLVTAFSHDGAEQDIFAALLSGAALYPFDVKRMLNPTELAALVQNRHITIWHSVPTLFRYFVEALSGQEDFSRLRWILLGGESLRSGDIAAFNRFFPHALLANVYGQTESSVNSICLYRPGDTFGRLLLEIHWMRRRSCWWMKTMKSWNTSAPGRSWSPAGT